MNIVKKVEAEIQLIFGKIPKEVNQYADQALAITKAIQSFLEDPVVDLAISLIPGSWAETVKSEVLAAITKSLPFLTIVNNCKDQTDPVELVKCWTAQLKTLPEGTVNGTMQQLAMYITYFLDSQKLSKSEYALITQLKYTEANA